MIANVILPLLILLTIYGLVILGLVLLIRKMGVSGKRAILFGFLVFGAATGILTAWIWPLDSSLYPNVFASLLGEQVYILSIQRFGDPNSSQAHYTIPWLLRIPQVYVLTSIVVCGLVSLPLQWVYNRRPKGNRENAS